MVKIDLLSDLTIQAACDVAIYRGVAKRCLDERRPWWRLTNASLNTLPIHRYWFCDSFCMVIIISVLRFQLLLPHRIHCGLPIRKVQLLRGWQRTEVSWSLKMFHFCNRLGRASI